MAGMLSNKKFAANCCGFSLIEVLIALFLQAFGMLGMTALQIKALKSTQAAQLDSHVRFLLTDMAERLRSNPGTTYAIAFTAATPVAILDCAVDICSSSELASWDIRQWRTSLEDAAWLPEGEGQVSFNALTQTYAIAIRYTWSQLAAVELIGNQRTVSLATSARE